MFIKRQLQMQIPSHKIIEDLKAKKRFHSFCFSFQVWSDFVHDFIQELKRIKAEFSKF